MRFMVLAIFVVFGCDPLAFAHAIDLEQRESLRGPPGVLVIVEELNPDARKDGLSQEVIQTAVELVLRSNGIRVLSKSELSDTPSMPSLFVNVYTLKNPNGLYAYSVFLGLSQAVRLLTKGEKTVHAPTWTYVEVGTVGHVNCVRS